MKIKDVINDTLKVWEKSPIDKKYRQKWSKTNLTMFCAFWLGNAYAAYDFYKNGFNFEVFVIYMSMALGLKGMSVWGKKVAKHP